jgi:hypothetical protein
MTISQTRPDGHGRFRFSTRQLLATIAFIGVFLATDLGRTHATSQLSAEGDHEPWRVAGKP